MPDFKHLSPAKYIFSYPEKGSLSKGKVLFHPFGYISKLVSPPILIVIKSGSNASLNRLIKNFERFLGGELNDAQVELLEIHARATINDVIIRLNNRTMRQKVFLEFLRTQPSEKELT